MQPVITSDKALLNGEELLSLSAVAAKLPGHRDNPRLNSSTLFRWITKGLRVAGGESVRLDAVKIGGAWRTSMAAVARFTAKLTAAAVHLDAPTVPDPTPKQRQRATAQASRKADVIFGAAN